MFRDNSFAGYPIISQHFCDIDGAFKPCLDLALLHSSFSDQGHIPIIERN